MNLTSSQQLLFLILRSASGTLVLRVFSMATIFVSRVMVARILGIAEFGVFSYALTWLDLLAVLAVFGADRMILRDVAIYKAREDWPRAKGVIRFTTLWVLGLSILVLITAEGLLWLTTYETRLRLSNGFLGVPAFELMMVDGAYYAVAIIIAALPLLAIIRVSRAVLQALHHIILGQVGEYALRPALYLLALLLIVFGIGGTAAAAWYMLLIYVITLVVAAVFSFWIMQRKLPGVFRTTRAVYQQHKWVSAMIPLVLLESAYFVNGRIAAIMLGLFTNSTAVGLFSVAERIMTLMALALYATNYALAPHFARLFSQQDWFHLQLITTWGARGVSAVASLAGLAFIIFAEPVLSLFGAEFVAASPVLVILIVGQLVNALCGSVSILLTTTYHENETTRAVLISAGLNLIASLLLIPAWGAVGAAVASTISLIYWNIHLVVYSRRKLGIDTTILGIFSKWHHTDVK